MNGGQLGRTGKWHPVMKVVAVLQFPSHVLHFCPSPFTISRTQKLPSSFSLCCDSKGWMSRLDEHGKVSAASTALFVSNVVPSAYKANIWFHMSTVEETLVCSVWYVAEVLQRLRSWGGTTWCDVQGRFLCEDIGSEISHLHTIMICSWLQT